MEQGWGALETTEYKPLWFTDRETEAQQGGEPCPRTHGSLEQRQVRNVPSTPGQVQGPGPGDRVEADRCRMRKLRLREGRELAQGHTVGGTRSGAQVCLTRFLLPSWLQPLDQDLKERCWERPGQRRPRGKGRSNLREEPSKGPRRDRLV